MNKDTVIGLLLGVIVGVTVTFGVVALKDSNETKQAAVTDHSMMSMAEMSEQLENLSGDDFDKAFIEMMIAHHQGAIDMAELSPDRAKHDEVKKLSEDIISAQQKEIADMKQWQEDWGYSSDDMMQMMHGNH